MEVLEQQISFVDQERPDDYPLYTVEERVADGIIHFMGIALSLIGFTWLLTYSYFHIDPSFRLALYTYGACVVALFICSASYHMTPWPEYRPLLRRFDQSAIFFKIAGTYTPLVAIVGTTFGYSVLLAIWIACLIGTGFKMATGDRLSRYTVTIYLALGWASVLLIWPLYNALPLFDTMLIVVGGLCYTIGVYFHQANGMKYNNAIWHAFVLCASLIHFTVVARTVLAGTV